MVHFLKDDEEKKIVQFFCFSNLISPLKNNNLMLFDVRVSEPPDR